VRVPAVSDQASDVRDGDVGLLDQQLSRHRHPHRQQILAEASATAAVGTLQLPRRDRERVRDRDKRERTTVVTRDQRAGKPMKIALLLDSGLAHVLLSDIRTCSGT
jgi:hypothetical protein